MKVSDFVFRTTIAIEEFRNKYGEPAVITVDAMTHGYIRQAYLRDATYFTTVLKSTHIKAFKGIPIGYRSTGYGYDGDGFVEVKNDKHKIEFGDLDDSWG